MAPRKTKTAEAAEAAPIMVDGSDVQVDVRSLDDSERLGRNHAALVVNMTEGHFIKQRRFEVALAVFPTIIGMGVAEPFSDENLAGAAARTAFEYADAFIAYGRKDGVDA